MILNTSELCIGLDELMPRDGFILKKVIPVYDYEEGKKTDRVIGHRYGLIDPETYDSFDVKVKGTKPIVENDRLEDRTNKVWVALENAIIKPYKIEFGRAVCSITADNIRILSDNN